MNPALISLHRQGVFRQAWFTLTSFTSDFGLSVVDYFPLIPKVHKIAVVSLAIHTFRNNYPSAVDNRFICSLLDMDFCAVQKQKKKKKKKEKENKQKTSRSNMNFLIGVPNTEYTRCPVGWLGEAKVSCILRHRVSNWYLLTGGQGLLSLQKVKVEGECFLFLLFLLFHSFSFLPCPSLSSPLLSPVSLLPFSGRRHKMTRKCWRVVKPQLNQINHTLPGDKTGTIHGLTDQ